MSRPSQTTTRTGRRLAEALQRSRSSARVNLSWAFRCDEAWESMTPVAERVRHCGRCDRDVHDLVGLDRAALVAHVRAMGGSVCAQVNAREDGRFVFGSCAGEGAENVRGGITIDPPDEPGAA